MAQKVEVVLVDDLDGTPAEETVQFSLDGRHYEIDLSVEHAKELRTTLKGYIRKARAVAPPAPANEAAKIREWAADNGYEVSRRGRLHRDIVEAYRNAKK
ncbi:Lsr2 family protein [Citricoccus sp.]|uniref:histone-like nucleoid-structuring protein Lsr2 n=1 Tax=Citricoccus sp. TaxID=1978372 RepID=UPI0028BE2076|nr:Lsr2 family protein [Citricoccus sp.]